MTSTNKRAKTIGSKNTVMKPVSIKFVNFAISIQNELQAKENKKKGKKKKVSFLHATLEIEKRFNK